VLDAACFFVCLLNFCACCCANPFCFAHPLFVAVCCLRPYYNQHDSVSLSGHDTFPISSRITCPILDFLLKRLEKTKLLPILLSEYFFLLPFIASKRPASCVASPLMWLDKEYETEKEYFKPLYQSPIASHLWVLSAYQSLPEYPFTNSSLAEPTEILGSKI
jgi:hypothetical protein